MSLLTHAFFGSLLIGVLLFESGLASESGTQDGQSVLSAVDSGFSGSPESELIQLFIYTRHGASTDHQFIFENEWMPYNLFDRGVGDEQLTALGMAQCWSAGKNIALKHSGFIQDSIEKESFLLNQIDLKKNKLCTDYIWYGVSGFVPFIGHFTDSSVSLAMETRGNCHDCPKETRFPFLETQMLSQDENQEHRCSNIKIHSQEFLDMDENCLPKKEFLCLTVDLLPPEDRDLLEKISPFFQEEDFSSFMATQMLFKHLYHNLPLVDGLENISSIFFQRSSNMKDGITDDLLKSLVNVHVSGWTLQALFARSLLRDLADNLKSQENALNIYAAHNNNLITFLVFLIGDSEPLDSYVTYYSSTIEIQVLQDLNDNSKFVKLVFDGEEKFIKGCEERCELEEFVNLIGSYLSFGGDLKSFCSSQSEPK